MTSQALPLLFRAGKFPAFTCLIFARENRRCGNDIVSRHHSRLAAFALRSRFTCLSALVLLRKRAMSLLSRSFACCCCFLEQNNSDATFVAGLASVLSDKSLPNARLSTAVLMTSCDPRFNFELLGRVRITAALAQSLDPRGAKQR